MNNKFSENLKKIRKDNNLSQEQLADEIGVSRQAISKWESSIAYPEMDKIIALCERFNLNIDDLLHKDIREIKGEEESKKNLNNFVDDFLNFITNTINMLSNMNFKSKCKCLFEQIIIIGILFIICLLLGILGQDLLSGIFGLMPDKLYYILHSILRLIYVIFATMGSTIIVVHIFKTRYLDYYEKIKKETFEENKEKSIDDEYEMNSSKDLAKNAKIDKQNKILFKKNEDKIIIRDPKHSEYKFINGIFKGIIGIIKFLTLCFSTILFTTLICFSISFMISFLIVKTGIFFIGILLAIFSMIVINIVLILFLLNFVFNRKNDKKKMIWSFIISLIILGSGSGLTLIGTLNFEYIEQDKSLLKTEYLELDMKNNLLFSSYPEVEYIESNNKNIKIEYTINKYCSIKHSNHSERVIYLWANCDNPIKIIKTALNNFNNKKIININNEIYNLKVYTTKENIAILKKNYNNYTDYEIQNQNMINSYEKRIFELQQKIDKHVEKEWNYLEEIENLKEQIRVYQDNNN